MECLCYTEEKGLYVDYSNGDKLPEGCLFTSHNSLNSRVKKIEVPNTDFKITIVSKLGNFRIKAWHYACLEYNGRYILNFDASTINFLNQKINYFSVIPGRWDELFHKIIKAWNYRECEQLQSVSDFLSKVCSLLDYNPIYVKSTLQHPAPPTLWKEPFPLILLASDILADYVSNLVNSTAYEKDIISKTVEVCSLFISKLKKDYHSFNMKASDSRVERLGKNTAIIINFMSGHQPGVEFLQITFNKLS